MSRRVRAFRRWMRARGFNVSDALELADSGGGLSVRALCALREGDLVAEIPKAACLTARTTGARDVIEERGLGGTLALALAVMYERSLGCGSPWDGYLQLLPERECVPLMWSFDEVDALLAGTELHKSTGRIGLGTGIQPSSCPACGLMIKAHSDLHHAITDTS